MLASNGMRLLIYSHDTFGLGHLRRCRAIAHSLVGQRSDLSVLILSGSPIIGSFDFRTRVDFVRFPGVVKLRNGNYTPRGLDISIEDAIELRETIITASADAFRPHIFLVDKEPLGLRGEVSSTLKMLRSRGTRLVLGLRDVLDDGELLREEWDRKNAMQALADDYHDIWVYGDERICDPLAELEVPDDVRLKMQFTGYLRRPTTRRGGPLMLDGDEINDPFILVTTGGGGDGVNLIDSVLKAYEHDPTITMPAVVVFGPFMHRDAQQEFFNRVDALPNVRAIDFLPNLEDFMDRSVGVIGMGGYNTVCEILSFNKPGLIVPRSVPRLEQTIRATRLRDLGLLEMLTDEDAAEPAKMAHAIHRLPTQSLPQLNAPVGLLDGFERIGQTVDHWLDDELRVAPVVALRHGERRSS